MNTSVPYIMEDPKKPYKARDQNPQKAKGMSFFVFVFSVFVYISAFYVFNLSPSSLIKTSTFWFLISNTLILILAVDFGAFSSLKTKRPDAYEEYVTHVEARRASPLVVAKIHAPLEQQQEEKDEDQISVETREAGNRSHVVAREARSLDGQRQEEIKETLESKPLHVIQKQVDNNDGIKEKRIVHVDHVRESVRKSKPYRRSQSEKAKRVAIDESKNIVLLTRSKTEKESKDEHAREQVEAVNEFANMSDEDLHRRVEEFIQRFNRQIRLQAKSDY